jgi:hypothetical protein
MRLFTARYCDRSSRRSSTARASSACCGGGVTASASGIAREAMAPSDSQTLASAPNEGEREGSCWWRGACRIRRRVVCW